jgi:hypothetical protein
VSSAASGSREDRERRGGCVRNVQFCGYQFHPKLGEGHSLEIGRTRGFYRGIWDGWNGIGAVQSGMDISFHGSLSEGINSAVSGSPKWVRWAKGGISIPSEMASVSVPTLSMAGRDSETGTGKGTGTCCCQSRRETPDR